MIAVFGASSDIGQRLVKKLRSAGFPTLPVSRRLEGAFSADLQTLAGVSEAVRDAGVIVSCAHARHTAVLVDACPATASLVLMGSAWRYSKVPNVRADEVRSAEALFLAGVHNGIMLHSSMIYGGHQEKNIQRLLQAIRYMPFVPVPGGGKQNVCPVYIDDLVDCLFAAATTPWTCKHVIGVAGPLLTWKRMAEITAISAGLRRRFISLPIKPLIAAVSISKRLGFDFMDPNILRRFNESIEISTEKMIGLLSVNPRPFSAGIVDALESWRK